MTTEAVEFTVTALARRYPAGLLIAHDNANVCLLFWPKKVPEKLSPQQAYWAKQKMSWAY